MSKFLRRGTGVPFASNKRDTHRAADKRQKATHCGQVKTSGLEKAAWRLSGLTFGRGRLNLKQAWDDNLPCAIAARWGGCMLYGISAVFDPVPFSNYAVFHCLDFDCLDIIGSRPPARAPDRPLSMR